jgi:enoyl-CoA hydratase/carnithine racemase
MEYKTIRYEVADGLAVLTLNRPHRSNAFTGRMDTEYHHAMYHADRDAAVGAIVLTGEGRHFCVGADSQALDKSAASGRYETGLREPLLQPGDPDHPAYGTPHGFPLAMAKPVISAVNGAAAGVGFVAVCFTDIRFAAEDAKFAPANARLGLPIEHAVSWILPKLIGHARATEILLSGRVFTAEEAHAIGLVHAVYPRDELLERTLDYARNLIDGSAPASLRTGKAQLTRDLFRPLAESAQESVRLIDELMAGPDFRRGAEALSRREPAHFADRYR